VTLISVRGIGRSLLLERRTYATTLLRNVK
jgi:hypothetical protein